MSISTLITAVFWLKINPITHSGLEQKTIFGEKLVLMPWQRQKSVVGGMRKQNTIESCQLWKLKSNKW
jgi:hypothetical protein